MSVFLPLLALALAAPSPPVGLPAAAAAVFHEMDRSLTTGDLEGLLALFDEGYRSPSAVDRREKIGSVTRSLRARYGDIELQTTILEGRLLDGGAVAVTVDHRLAFNGSSRTIGKTYLLRRDDAGSWRIRFGVDVEEGGPRMPAPPEVEAPLLGVIVSAPEGWLSLPTRSGLLIQEDLLVHPAMDHWISIGILDPGARTTENLFAIAKWRLEAGARDRASVLERGTRTVGPLEGPYMRLHMEAESGPGRIIEITYLAAGDGLVLRLAWSGPGDVAVRDPDALLQLRMLPPGSGPDTVAHHRAGEVDGRRYRNAAACIRFSVPEGWSLRVQASPLPYLAQASGPRGEILQVGAWRKPEGPEGAARRLPPGGAEVTVGGRIGWRAPGTEGFTSVYVRGEDGLVHFFTLEGSDRAGESLDRILATVEWSF